MRCTSGLSLPAGTGRAGERRLRAHRALVRGQRRFAAGLAPDARARDGLAVFDEARSWLDAYFNGGRLDAVPLLAPWAHRSSAPSGTSCASWGVAIPLPTASWRLARAGFGRATSPRAVGSAAGRNPVSSPVGCHRAPALTARDRLRGRPLRKRALCLEREGLVVAEAPERPRPWCVVADVLGVLGPRDARLLLPGEVGRMRPMVPDAIGHVPLLLVAPGGRADRVSGHGRALVEDAFVDPAERGNGVAAAHGAGDWSSRRRVLGERAEPAGVRGFYEHLGLLGASLDVHGRWRPPLPAALHEARRSGPREVSARGSPGPGGCRRAIANRNGWRR